MFSTTVTLGASGDTITLACGASQTGFGRTGAVRLGLQPILKQPLSLQSVEMVIFVTQVEEFLILHYQLLLLLEILLHSKIMPQLLMHLI